MASARTPRIHPTAVIASEAELADDVQVGPYVVIEGRVHIGPGCILRPHAYLCGPLSQDSGDPACWRPVRKRRRISRFSLVNGQIVTQVPRPGQHPRAKRASKLGAKQLPFDAAQQMLGLTEPGLGRRRIALPEA